MPKQKIAQNEDAENLKKTAEQLESYLCKGDVVLIKASRGVGAEKILEYIKTNFD